MFIKNLKILIFQGEMKIYDNFIGVKIEN